MFDLWIKNWRRRRIVRRPTPAHWPQILDEGLWYWKELDARQRSRLLPLIAIFLHEKELVLPPSVSDPEACRVVVAGCACLMLLGFDDWYCFDRVETIVLSPTPFVQQVQIGESTNVFGMMVAAGVYAKGAPIRLVWPDVQRQCREPRSIESVLIHEFAHHIDDLDGALAGDPPFQSRGLELKWREIAEQEMERLETAERLGLPTVLDPYGLTNPVEFFAVACEAFFCLAPELDEHHPELFRLLSTLFRLDPRVWFKD